MSSLRKTRWSGNDFTRKVNFYSNGNLNALTTVDWRDSLSSKFLEDRGELEAALPQVCRYRIVVFLAICIYIRAYSGQPR